MRYRFLAPALCLLAVACGGEPAEQEQAATTSSQSELTPLPDACEILRTIDVATLFDGEPTIDGSGTQCTANVGYANVTLMVSDNLAGREPASPAAQAESFVESMTAGDDSVIIERPADIGEAAVWLPDVNQAHVYYRGGRTYLVIGANRFDDGKAVALEVAQKITSSFP